ncbi:putative RNA splicing factor (Pad-1) [Aspergillus brunneoviolaceus CBS 621.78]|uniref:Splicing factor, CC1-like protein n=2 Tax=Aspergillus TaxID=5052 RepID=A0A8G1RV42_9EURO|nr:splicing factor, CC1-like protein [Aspergillus brunneoviolaceus CBS 621.78]XP_040802410.1 splicing factor, CC1-like protein [Aspergillus fijiensis CBS 313.89]RAH46549.1 splicing factor, CC1-like protein [Aspergillus brunneoviolaceus CBS 621.78]RAK78400.1 splicing factor, CC1-like protein [Aspergillus fijiensis CBS 313.89]
MSGLDVEALLESTAAPTPQEQPPRSQDHDDRSTKGESSERRDRDRSRENKDRKRRDRSRGDRRRSRDGDGDEEMKSPRSEHGSANGSHRSRKRSKSRDSDRRRSRRDRDRHGDDYRSSGGDFYRGGGRARTRSRSPYDDRYYRPSGRSRHDDRDEDRRPSRREREGGRRRSPSARSRERTPELNEDERDRRTIFVQQLAARLRTKELIAFFEKVGPVKEAQIVKDRVSGRSKGVGYVEFKNEDSVAPAIQLTGQKLLGIPIIAQLTEAEKNRQARNPEASSSNNHAAPFHRLYVGNIHFSITESDLQNVFEPFGELEFVQLQKDETGRSRGYGFVQFRDPNQAREALEKMNGFDLAGRAIRVGLGNDKFTPDSNAQRMQGQGANQHNFQGSLFSGHGGRGVQAGGTNNFDRAGGRDSEKGAGASALDDTDVAGVNFNNYSRDALMRKLARTDEPSEPAADDQQKVLRPKTEAKPLPVNVSMASRCVMLRNMFDPNEEEGDVWVKELEDDVRAECEEKYGHVVHISLDPNSQGDIYLKFDRVQGGENAIKGLNGRFFGGRQITAQPVVDAVYSSLFSRTKAI